MNEQAVSTPQLGNDDSVLAMMKAFNLPMTRESYLELAYMGDIPPEISSEVEAGMPEQFRE